MVEYHKLVRDKIPEMIAKNGERPVVRILEEQEYFACLEKKLDEEVLEFHTDRNAEELADILEVVFSLGRCIGVEPEQLLSLCKEKREARGGFENRIFLIGKE